ncbi:MAG: class I SAM-dependent methyltransferase [Gemmataceae bacterium]|nr:class I SAM-dependent methyltransferase [Gemmataceae bacterium]
MSKQAERDYATKVDQTHLFGKPFNDPRVFREFALVLEVFGERLAGGTILDIGCGPGWTSLFLARAGYKVVGVDISERMIEIAREQISRDNAAPEFVVGDMEDMDLGRADFDGALFFDCLHHCPAYAKALKRAYAHLRPGGHVLLLETTWLHRYSPHARQVTREFGVTELGFTRRQLRRALREAGFSDLSFYHDPGSSYRGVRGFLKACLRLGCGYFFYYPQAKNIVVARKG